MKDTIYREDAIEAILNRLQSLESYASDVYRRGLYEAQEIIEALPSADAVKVAYICDGRKCENDCSDCFRTLDIEHARDFNLMGDTYYQQASADVEQVTGKLIDGLEMLRFFNQRAGRELWQTKPREIQNTDIKDADEILSKAISALSAEAVQGEWIECLAYDPDLDADILYIECDQCGHRPYFSGSYRPKYCEECGARMTKGGDDE